MLNLFFRRYNLHEHKEWTNQSLSQISFGESRHVFQIKLENTVQVKVKHDWWNDKEFENFLNAKMMEIRRKQTAVSGTASFPLKSSIRKW